ncbi:MAG: hypothetical protein ICV66_07190 [Chitinophagaceae bacterium]|nr:hypothetical protein [Chitinophagaceae bacterium]
MGKDHRGKPSGVDKQEGLGLRKTMPPEKLQSDEEMTEKYTDGPDELKDNVHVLHPNRNTGKSNKTGPAYS